MDFRILGSVEVLTGGQPLPVGGPKQRALLAYLLLNEQDVVSAERLIEELWYDPPGGGVQAVQTQVSRLRRALGGRITTSGSGYTIDLEPGELDLGRFRSLLAEAGAALEPGERSRLLREADALWHGTPLQGVDGPFVAAEVRALEELRLAAVEERIEADLDAGRHAALVAELSSLVSRHPLRERLRGQLILALYRSDRQAEALSAFRDTRRMLDEELGIEPSPALRELELAILRHDPSLARPAAPRLGATEESTRPRRRRAGLAVGAVVALGVIAAATAALTHNADPESAPPTPATSSTVTQAARRTTHVTSTHHPRRRIPRHRSPATTRQVVRTTTTSAPVLAAAAPPQQQTTTTQTTSAVTTKPAAQTKTTPSHKSTARTKTTPTRTPATPPPKPVTISDTFGGDFVDPTIWHQVTTDANVSIAEQNGELVLTVGPAAVRGGAYNQIDVHVGTQCSFPGDFDARVDFNLLEWPQADNIFVGLSAIFAGSVVGRESSSQWGDNYVAWVVPGNNGSVALPDTSGSLRITRVKGTETAYVRHGGGWSRVAAGRSQGAAVFGLQAMSPDATSAFGQQELKVAFDNFTVTGTNPICPPGSGPPSR
ncbi:MAG TPA: BTAD domain-containing putative transcriptional regulator [Gaiellaceae bacterium]|nr:BTAD domain-containing putative transcriptional regulator [Gaiellaceae bacterium]